MKIKISQLKSLISKTLRKQGYSASETRAISDVLLYAQLRNNNQGIVKLTGPGMPKSPEAGLISKTRETKLSVVLNGAKNSGMVVMNEALKSVIKKAKKNGFGIAGINNTFSSTGAIGYYVEKIAREGLIGFAYAGSPETVAPHGSYEPYFGTNPLAVGIPTLGEPIVLDMATAAIPYYGLVEASLAKTLIPSGVAYDQNGKITTSPSEAMNGAILSFDKSHKGSGLGLINEILTGPLVAAGFTGIKTERGWGNLVFAIDPSLLVDSQQFISETTQLKEKLKLAKRNRGVEEIFLPGERGNKLAQERLSSGLIEIEDGLLGALKVAAN